MTMRQIARPPINLTQLYSQCVNQKQNANLRQRLVLSQPTIVQAAQQYEGLGLTMSIYQFAQPQMPVGGATSEEIGDLYVAGLVRKTGAGRWAYDQIMAAAPHGLCPLCAQRTVGTLDHYLPKELVWTLAITPANLIPACRDCNFEKHVSCPQDESSQSFHPYFDSTDDAQWLFASIERAGGLSVRFYVQDVPAWTPERRLRAHHHFGLFKLERLYATQAAVELVNMEHRLARLLAVGGPDAVRDHLREEALSRRNAHMNSWQTALYQVLSEDEEFCAGDFQI
jgi:hypothetical protein